MDVSEQMSEEPHTPPPPPELTVDYGTAKPGSKEPMPDERREYYQQRIKSVVKAQASGAKKATKLFIR
jgi:hypothetical protein